MTVTDRFLKVTILSDIEERQETRFSAALRGQSRRKAKSQVSVPVPEELLVENAMYRGILVGLHACSYVK